MKSSLPLLLSAAVFCAACSKTSTSTVTSADNEEVGQQIGDAMASVDESGGSSGSLAGLAISHEKLFARLAPPTIWEKLRDGILPQAHAVACRLASTFGNCSNNVITRTFGGCTIGGVTFDGTVTLTYNDASVNSTCQMTTTGHSISRAPDFTATGRRSSTLDVTTTGSVGQLITKSATTGQFTFSNDGIRRVFTNSGGTTTFDFTTRTTANITITGTTRATRVMNGGTLRVTNNLDSVTCDYAPTNVAWDSTCTCAVSGDWDGSCSDGSTTSLEITGCGTGDLTVGESTVEVTFDRCESI